MTIKEVIKALKSKNLGETVEFGKIFDEMLGFGQGVVSQSYW